MPPEQTNESMQLTILKSEQTQARNRLLQQITMVRTTLDNIERTIKRNEPYMPTGLQGSGVDIDVYLAKYDAYTRAVELFERQLRDKRKTEE